MKRVVISLLVLGVVGSVLATSFTDTDKAKNHGKTGLKNLTEEIDANFALIEAGTATETLANGKVLIGSAANVATAQTLSGDVTLVASGAVTIGAGVVEETMLSTATQDKVAYITVTGADLASAGTGTATIQAKDAAGNNLAASIYVRTWVGTADDFGADALTGFTVSTGTDKEIVTTNAEHLAISDTNGVVVMALDAGGADSVWVWAELGGRVVSSGEIVLTAP